MTGMGEVIPIGDSNALADAILKIFANPENYLGDPEAIARRFDPQANAAGYEAFYQELMDKLE